MDKAHPLSSLMVVHSLDVKNYLFHHYENGDELLGLEVPYLSDICALMYLSNCIFPDIAFSINLFVKYNFAPTQRHLSNIKHLLYYLQGTTDMGIFYSKESKQQLLMQDTFQIHIKLDHK